MHEKGEPNTHFRDVLDDEPNEVSEDGEMLSCLLSMSGNPVVLKPGRLLPSLQSNQNVRR